MPPSQPFPNRLCLEKKKKKEKRENNQEHQLKTQKQTLIQLRSSLSLLETRGSQINNPRCPSPTCSIPPASNPNSSSSSSSPTLDHFHTACRLLNRALARLLPLQLVCRDRSHNNHNSRRSDPNDPALRILLTLTLFLQSPASTPMLVLLPSNSTH